jgi:hypothetical protein
MKIYVNKKGEETKQNPLDSHPKVSQLRHTLLGFTPAETWAKSVDLIHFREILPKNFRKSLPLNQHS